MSENPDIRPLPVDVANAYGGVGGFYAAPAGTPIPTDVDSALEGFVEIGTVSRGPSFGIDPETLREFAEQRTGRPYVWPDYDGDAVSKFFDGVREAVRPIVEQFTATFRGIAESIQTWKWFFGEFQRERSPRSVRRRKNRLRRKRIARKRRRG